MASRWSFITSRVFHGRNFELRSTLLARPRASIIKTSQQLRVTSALRSRRIASTQEGDTTRLDNEIT